MDDQAARMRELQQRIAELRARLPKHSAPALSFSDKFCVKSC